MAQKTDGKKDNCGKNKLSAVFGASWLLPVLLAVVIAAQTAYISHIFFFRKTAYFCDEIYSYGLSNSFYNPYLESENVYSNEGYNANIWFSGKMFHDYLTVQPSERFRYDSVWYNQEHDRHPPLFYSVLHTVCSFMPDQFSFVPGFVINIICFAVTQVFLYLLARGLLRSRYLALLFTLFWGFSMAAVNITVFVRMYCMLTMWTVILMYLHSRLYESGEDISLRMCTALAVCTMLGGLTQYLFYFVAFITAVLFCVHYLINKKLRLFLKYGFSMLGGVAGAFLVYPASFRQLFSEGDHAVGIDFSAQLPIALRYISGDIFRLTESEMVWLLIAVPLVMLIALLLSLPLLFLFRKNERLVAFFNRMKNGFRGFPSRLSSLSLKKLSGAMKKANPLPYAMLLSVAALIVVVSYTVSFLSGFCNRYFYIILPIAALLVFILLRVIFGSGKAGKTVITLLSAAVIVHIICFSSLSPVWTTKNTTDLRKLFAGCNVGVIYSSDLGYDTMSTFSYELCDTDSVFYTTSGDVTAHEAEAAKLDSDNPVYVMVYASDYGKDSRGEYVVDIKSINDRKYIDDLLKPFEGISGIGGYEYVDDYTFVEGHFRIYRMT